MEARRSPLSGTGFTMVTGVGGAPVDRRTADRLCQNRPVARTDEPKPDSSKPVDHRR